MIAIDRRTAAACSECGELFVPMRLEHLVCLRCYKMARAVEMMRRAHAQWLLANAL